MKHLIGIMLCLILASFVDARPWMDVGEARLRQHLQVLHDAGHIDVSLTTWPIMWAEVDRALSSVDAASLRPSERYALRELRFEMRAQSRKGFKRSVAVSASSDPDVVSNFAHQHRYVAQLAKRLEWDGDRVAFGLQGNLYWDRDDDELSSHLDGSYLAFATDNWVFGAGALTRWWGPSASQSLILGNQARPVPAVFVRSKAASRFETPWLSWLGYWQFVGFVGQLESSRVVPEAKLTGMRFTLKPIDGLEIGLSRAMQWGGEGRDDGLDAFFKSLTSQDENTEEGAGNQLGGFDARYGFALGDALSSALYFQAIGEDEAGFMPSKYTVQLGMEGVWAWHERAESIKIAFEYIDTTAGALVDSRPNTAYNHSIYKSGYRFRGEPLGAGLDNDSRAISLRASWVRSNRQQWQAGLARWEINRDGGGLSSLSSSAVELWVGDIAYSWLWSEVLFDLRAKAYSSGVESLQKESERYALFAGATYRL